MSFNEPHTSYQQVNSQSHKSNSTIHAQRSESADSNCTSMETIDLLHQPNEKVSFRRAQKLDRVSHDTSQTAKWAIGWHTPLVMILCYLGGKY